MNKTYTFKYRSGWFTKKIKNAVSHSLDESHNRMYVHMADETLISIPQWNKKALMLGQDWMDYVKEELKGQTGQEVL